ncbi:MAG: AraC family transcriptional regulator [Lentisphaerales bacterium]|nr:AraC family transcriptional regulator [Lentisphaerales bacterium]
MIYIDSIQGELDKELTLASISLKKERRGFVCQHYVMVLLLKGAGTYIEEDTGITHKLEQGDVYQRFPGRSHAQVLDTDNNEQFFLRVPTDLFTLLNDRGQLNLNPVLKIKGDTFQEYQQCFIDCQRESDGAYALWRIKDLIVKLHKMSLGENSLSVIEQAIHSMEKRIHERQSLAEIASNFNMSYISFRRKFKKTTGVSPGAWLIQKRIVKAVDLLNIETLKIDEISQYLGYPDIYTFSKQFKKVTGTSPSDFRQNLLLNSSVESHT